jgi:hypothetical protein
MFKSSRVLAAATLAVAGGLLAGCNSSAGEAPPETVPDRVTRLGELEVVTHTRATQGANYGGRDPQSSWSLRWRGQPVAIDSLGGMWLDQPVRAATFNAVFVVGEGAQPDLLVNAGDPNNASVFHLIRQGPDGLAAPVLCKAFAGDNTVTVLAGSDAGRRMHGPHHRSLPGAQRLQLGAACVYDVATGRALALPAAPEDAHFLYDSTALVLSPDGRACARVGRLAESGVPVMLVADLEQGRWSPLRIDATRMRFADPAAIDAAWVMHHFAWRRGADGRDRLVERAGFRPLPPRGRFLAGAAQYDVPQAEIDSSQRLGDFLVRRFQARRLPGSGNWREMGLSYEVERETVNVTGAGFFIAGTGKPYQAGEPGDPERQRQLIRRIGEAFDAELASGRHDAMFVAAPEVRQPR